MVNGPYRVFPGRLSVSRTIGDFEGKLPQLGAGGIKGVVSSIPEIGCIEIGSIWDTEDSDNKKILEQCDQTFDPSVGENADFLIVGCDGVFDRLESDQIVEKCWTGLRKKYTSPNTARSHHTNDKKSENMHDVAASMVEDVLQETFEKKAWDNISVIMICFKDLIQAVKQEVAGQELMKSHGVNSFSMLKKSHAKKIDSRN